MEHSPSVHKFRVAHVPHSLRIRAHRAPPPQSPFAMATRRSRSVGANSCSTVHLDEEYIVHTGGKGALRANIHDISADDTGTFERLRDLQMKEMAAHQSTWLAMTAKLQEIQICLHNSVCETTTHWRTSSRDIPQQQSEPTPRNPPRRKSSRTAHPPPTVRAQGTCTSSSADGTPKEESDEEESDADIPPPPDRDPPEDSDDDGSDRDNEESDRDDEKSARSTSEKADEDDDPSGDEDTGEPPAPSTPPYPPPQVRTSSATRQANHQKSICGTSDIRLTQTDNSYPARRQSYSWNTGTSSSWSDIPGLPHARVHPDKIDPASPNTVYAVNIAFGASERDIIEFFNSVGGAFEHRCTALSAVNLPYRKDPAGLQIFQGQGFFMYGTLELAAFALRTLHGRTFRGRPLRVEMSRHPLDCRATNGANIRGQSRWGDNIFECPPPP